MITFTLPWPSSVNHHYARTRRGGVRLTDEARAWRAEVALIVREHTPPELPLSISLQVMPPDRRRRDPDNILKEVLDAVMGTWGIDDNLENIYTLEVTRGTPLQPRGTIVAVVS